MRIQSVLLHSCCRAGDSRGGGRGRPPQQRAGTGSKTQSFEHSHHNHNIYSSKQQHFQQQKQNQQQHQHYRQQSSPDFDEPRNFHSTPRDFYTPYVTPRYKAVAVHDPASQSSDGDFGYNSACYTDSNTSHTNKNNISYAGQHHDQQPQHHYSSCSNGSSSPYQNLEERSRKADGVPVRARVSPEAQHHFLSTVNSDDGQDGKGFLIGGSGSSSTGPGSSSRKGHLQTTPAPFCYECGSKYPLSSAKFCCHCGAKRASCR